VAPSPYKNIFDPAKEFPIMNFSILSVRLNRFSLVVYALAIILIAYGLTSWNRLPEPSLILFPSHGEVFENDKQVVNVGERLDLCDALNEPGGYLLISGSINLTKIGLDQGFFQTADEENGIYLDIESGGQVRLGVHLRDGTTTQVMFRHKYRTGLFNYAILIGADSSIRIVGDQNDIQVQLNDIKPMCSNVRIGAGNETESVGAHVIANISVGDNLDVANAELDSYVSLLTNSQNSSTYKWPLYFGIIVLLSTNTIRKLFRGVKSK
jgi:hypothetical protein